MDLGEKIVKTELSVLDDDLKNIFKDVEWQKRGSSALVQIQVVRCLRRLCKCLEAMQKER